MPSSLFNDRNTLDLRQLDVQRPDKRGVLSAEVGAEQVISIAVLGLFQLVLIELKAKAVARDCLIAARQLNRDEPKARPASFFAAPIRINN